MAPNPVHCAWLNFTGLQQVVVGGTLGWKGPLTLMARTPVPTGFILSPIVHLFLSRFPSPWGQPSTLKETETGMSQDIPSWPTHPACLGSESANTHSKHTGYTGRPAATLVLIPTQLCLSGWHLPYYPSEAHTLSAALPSTFTFPRKDRNR